MTGKILLIHASVLVNFQFSRFSEIFTLLFADKANQKYYCDFWTQFIVFQYFIKANINIRCLLMFTDGEMVKRSRKSTFSLIDMKK